MPAQRRKTSADGSTPKRAVAAPPPARAEAMTGRQFIYLRRTDAPRTGRDDSPSTGPASPSAATPPHGQRRSADKSFRRTRFAALAHTPRRPQAAGATPSRRASMRRGPGSAGFKIEAAPKTERKRAGFEEPGTSGALATRGRRIDLARAICGNFSQSSFTLLSK